MARQKLWFGYLEAGSKSSPVVIDRSMGGIDGNTLFAYNHNKKEIKKYVRDLIEPKLRELTAEEKKLEASLKKGFSASLKNGNFKVPKALNIPEKENTTSKPEKIQPEEALEVDGLTDDADDDWIDSDD